MISRDTIVLLVLGALSFLANALLFRSCSPQADAPTHTNTLHTQSIRVEQVHDTVRIVRQPIVYNAPAAKVEFIRDTQYLTHAFIATHDTVIVRDTIRQEFAYPQMAFSLAIRRSMDSIPVINTRTIINDTFRITNTLSRPLWIDILSHAGAAGAGYLIGRNIQP